jgi:hypothetical protein
MRFFKSACLILIVCFGIILCGLSPVYPQDVSMGNAGTRAPSDKTFRWGVKAGTTLSQFNQSGLTMGFNGGFIAKYQINQLLDVQGEVLYKMHGSGRDDYYRSYADIGGNVTGINYMNRVVSLQSAEIPILAIFKLGSVEESIVPKALIGASYRYCFAAFERHDKHYFFSDGTEGIVGNQIENVLSDYENHQFDVIGGIGIDFNLNNGKLFMFDVRYNYGLNDINLFKSPYVGGALYQSTLSINFSYAF